MPASMEQSYLDQAYRLPDGFSWEVVAGRRARWAIADMFVPVAVAPGCVGLGVPFVDGVPLRHP